MGEQRIFSWLHPPFPKKPQLLSLELKELEREHLCVKQPTVHFPPQHDIPRPPFHLCYNPFLSPWFVPEHQNEPPTPVSPDELPIFFGLHRNLVLTGFLGTFIKESTQYLQASDYYLCLNHGQYFPLQLNPQAKGGKYPLWCPFYIVVYSITSKKSFKYVKEEVEKIRNQLNPKEYEKPIVIVGNKCDLEEKRKILVEEGRDLAEELNVAFIETSAKTPLNFRFLLSAMLELAFFRSGQLEKFKFDKNSYSTPPVLK
jgi:hypothetical protein